MRIEEHDGAIRFAVYVQPRASRSEIAGAHGDAVKIRLAAPPIEDKANAELVAFLAKKLGVPRSAVQIVRGARGRNKLMQVEGVSANQIRAALG